MRFWLTDQTRLMALVALCTLLWSLESIVPLYRYQDSRVRHALPNVGLTLMLILTNLTGKPVLRIAVPTDKQL